jgi:hypothetical protein
MHISEVEKARLDKEHEMRHGYQMHNNNKFPHTPMNAESQHIFRDSENKHAMEYKPNHYETGMESE